MKRAVKTIIAVSLVGALSVSGGAMAEAEKGKGTNSDPAKVGTRSPATQAVFDTQTADALARYGDANKDALALIVAAKIKKQAGVKQGEFKLVSKDKPGEAKNKPALTPEAMLERAKTLAAGRQDLIGLADDVASSGTRGAVIGPRESHRLLFSGGTDQYQITFRAGEAAAVAISGDGDSRLDLYVYDQNGNRVCAQIGPGDDAACGWVPLWTGLFTIRVVNRGIANEYYLVTN